MDGIEMICFEIISNVGMARGSYVEAIDLATEGKFDEARAKIEEGNQFFVKGHEAHADLIQKEAAEDGDHPCSCPCGRPVDECGKFQDSC